MGSKRVQNFADPVEAGPGGKKFMERDIQFQETGIIAPADRRLLVEKVLL
jgi:hypothetical protein